VVSYEQSSHDCQRHVEDIIASLGVVILLRVRS
jgi:hypothetical protein